MTMWTGFSAGYHLLACVCEFWNGTSCSFSQGIARERERPASDVGLVQ